MNPMRYFPALLVATLACLGAATSSEASTIQVQKIRIADCTLIERTPVLKGTILSASAPVTTSGRSATEVSADIHVATKHLSPASGTGNWELGDIATIDARRIFRFGTHRQSADTSQSGRLNDAVKSMLPLGLYEHNQRSVLSLRQCQRLISKNLLVLIQPNGCLAGATDQHTPAYPADGCIKRILQRLQ